MKITNSFAISILAMLLALLSGYLKLGTEAVIASIAATYVLGRASQKASNVWASSKDPAADTAAVIREQEKS
jgi:hypothetical protein